MYTPAAGDILQKFDRRVIVEEVTKESVFFRIDDMSDDAGKWHKKRDQFIAEVLRMQPRLVKRG